MTSTGKQKMIDCLFAYGPLMPGFIHFPLLGEVGAVEPARCTGQLFHLDYRWPVLLDAGEGTVQGQLIKLRYPRDVLKTIDDLKGFTEYDPATLDDLRIVKDVQTAAGDTVQAYCYVFPAERAEFVKRVGRLIEDGSWQRFLVAREYLGSAQK